MMKMRNSLSRTHRDEHPKKTMIINEAALFDEETITLMMMIAELP
jgi:hypothetical protein